MNFPALICSLLYGTVYSVPDTVGVLFVADIPAITCIPTVAGTIPATAAIVPVVLLSAFLLFRPALLLFTSVTVPVVSAAVDPPVLMFLLTPSRDSLLLLASRQVLAILLLLTFLLLLSSLLLLAYLLLLTSLLFLAFLLQMTSQPSLLACCLFGNLAVAVTLMFCADLHALAAMLASHAAFVVFPSVACVPAIAGVRAAADIPACQLPMLAFVLLLASPHSYAGVRAAVNIPAC